MGKWLAGVLASIFSTVAAWWLTEMMAEQPVSTGRSAGETRSPPVEVEVAEPSASLVQPDRTMWEQARASRQLSDVILFLIKNPRSRYAPDATSLLREILDDVGDQFRVSKYISDLRLHRHEARPLSLTSIKGPGFNCKDAATLVEQAICGDPILAKLDGVMGALYQSSMETLDRDRSVEFRQRQRSWISHRDRLCGIDLPRYLDSMGKVEFTQCLRHTTKQRIEYLVDER